MKRILIYIFLFFVIFFPELIYGIKPIGTIGQPIPETHHFLSNEKFLRINYSNIQIVDIDTGKIEAEFGERTFISEVVVSPNMSHLAILNYDSDRGRTSVNIWDIGNRQLVSQWEIPSFPRKKVVFSPTQPILAISGNDEIQLWNWQNKEIVGKLTREGMLADLAMIYSNDGHHLIVVTNRTNVEIWNVETHKLDEQFGDHIISNIQQLIISPNGNLIAMYGINSIRVYVFDLSTRQFLRKFIGSGNVTGLSFSSDSKKLYVAQRSEPLSGDGKGGWQGWDDNVRVWNTESGEMIDRINTEYHGSKSISLSPDDNTMLLYYRDVEVLWDMRNREVINIWTNFFSYNDPAITPDGNTMVAVSQHALKIWDIPSQKLRVFVTAGNSKYRNFALSPDSKKVVVGRDPWLEIRDLDNGKIITQIPYQYGHTDIAFSSTGKWVAAKGFGYVRLYNTQIPSEIQDLTDADVPKSRSGSYYVFSEDDKYLAVTSVYEADHRRLSSILLWKREGDVFQFQYSWNVSEQSFGSHSRPIFTSYSDERTLLAITSGESTQIWHIKPDEPELLMTLDPSHFLRFSPDGQYLLTEKDNNLIIWDWEKNNKIDHPPILDYFDLSQNGKVLVSFDISRRIHIWDATKIIPSTNETTTSVESKGKKFVTLGQIKRNQLLQNFPNPFNPETWIPFRIADESNVTIDIFSSTGEIVRTLSLGTMKAGNYTTQTKAVYWDGLNNDNEPVSSVYISTQLMLVSSRLHAGC